MFNVEIYVDGTRLDLFDDENIQITDTIQDTRDPASIFTSFTQTFTVPASKTNNKVFKHYYNHRLLPEVSGYDGRFKVDATIRINGFDYRPGKLKLNSVKLKNGKPYSYNVNFVGDGANLRELVEKTDVGELSYLNRFNHDYSLTNVEAGLENGLGLNGSSVMAEYDGTTVTTRPIIYPLISHTKRYVYDSTATTYPFYNSAVTAGSEGLQYTQLKPALKVSEIINAIEYKFGITFSNDFFSTSDFNDLYIWLNRTKGFIEGVDDNITTFGAEEWIDPPTSGDDVSFRLFGTGDPYDFLSLRPYNYGPSGPRREYTATYSTTITGSGLYDFDVYDRGPFGGVGGLLYSNKNLSGNQNLAVAIEVPQGEGAQWVEPTVVITSAGTITAIDLSVSIEERIYSSDADATATTRTGVYDIDAPVTPNNFVTISAVMPKITVLDFLRNLFRMFNLTHYRKADGTIYVDTLDNFYALGSDIDITEMIDSSEADVEVPIPYDYIGFKYEEPNTFLAKNRLEILNDIWGDETYSLGDLFGGKEYEIKVSFSRLLFERLEDLSSGSLSNHLFGWAVDEDENATAGKPLILYRRGEQTGADISFDGGSTLTKYQRLGSSTGTRSLNFGKEFDEYVLDSTDLSLYEVYWENYISEIYGSGARLVKYTAYLTPSFILKYNLYDKIIVNGIKHKINSITIDLIDGKAELELITEP